LEEEIALSPIRREESIMPFTGVINPEQLSVLTKALQDYCRDVHIEPSTAAYNDAGRLALLLFESGITTADELTIALHTSAK
jgi:hypothetical protein